MKKTINTLMLLSALLIGANAATANNDGILGVYKVMGETTNEQSKVRIYKNGDTYEARIIWLEFPNDENGNPRLDDINPDPALRSVRGDNIKIAWGLKYDEKKNAWTGGTIYDPVAGKTFDVMMEFEGPSILKVRGYIGKPVFGKNFQWIKIE